MPKSNVAVVVPVHNGADLLPCALRSIVGQTLPPDEVIVVDDGSLDGSAAVARQFSGVSCIEISHSGQAAALNCGVRASHSELLAFLDSDDEWSPDKLEHQCAALRRDGALEAVFGYAEQWQQTSNGGQSLDMACVAHLPSAMLIRRKAFQRVGTFSTEIGLGMVIEWYARAQECDLKEAVLSQVVYRRWIHDRNTGLVQASRRSEYAAMLQIVLARRRQCKRDSQDQ